MENASKIKERLFGLTSKGIRYKLERIQQASQRCGNPHEHGKSFHVGGTNGKGSVCHFIEAVLRTSGYTTGLYTSPHLIDFEERFRINGVPVAEAMWLEVYRDLESIISEFSLTFFEATTLIAFELFRRNKVQWAIYEVGLGGRLDATNIVLPNVSVITSLAMDHAQYLGNTIQRVADEKLGIVKHGVPLVMAAPPSKYIRLRAEKRCKKLSTHCTFVSTPDASFIDVGRGNVRFSWQDQEFSLSTIGEHQLLNCLVALHALEQSGYRDWYNAVRAINKLTIPGRFQVELFGTKNVVFDVGHNPDAARSIATALATLFPGRRVCFVIGIMADKDIAEMLSAYTTSAYRLIFTQPKTERAADASRLNEYVSHQHTAITEVIPDITNAVHRALAGTEDVICITGSFYTVGEAIVAFREVKGREEDSSCPQTP